MGMFDTTPYDPQSFNYATQADKIKRQRMLADQLMAAKQPGTQTVAGGAGGSGVVVRNSPLTNLGPMIQQLLGAYASSKQDDAQTDLDKNSLDAFNSQYAGLNAQSKSPGAPAQPVTPASSGVDAGALVGGAGATTTPVPDQTPDASRDLSASVPDSAPSPVTSVSPAAGALPTQQIGSMLSGSPPQPNNAPPAAQPTPQPVPTTPGPVPGTDPALTDTQKVGRLISLGRTGPEGQMVANAQLNQMFASKNGRFTTAVHADPVNGGFVEVTTDTQTGQSQVKPIGSTGGKVPSGEVTGADGTRYNRFKDGTTAQMLGPDGQPLKDASVLKQNDDQQVKLGAAVVANQSAQSAISSSIARLNRIDQLSKETETGPLMGHLPNWTAKRQELSALLAQDVFAETRDAVAGAADAGGAPRMAQSEFKYMTNNGGLTQTMDPTTTHNLIAQQKLRLNALQATLASHAQTLNAVAPAAQRTGSSSSKPMLYTWQK